MKGNPRAAVCTALAVASWSTAATAFALALAHQSPFEVLLVASATAVVALAVALTLRCKWGALRAAPRATLLRYCLLGLLNPVAYYLMLFGAYDRLPPQIAQPVNYTWPILLVVLLALRQRQRVPLFKYGCMALSLAGVVVISSGAAGTDAGFSFTGLAMGLCSALLWAAYWVAGSGGGTIDEVAGLFLGFCTGTLCLLLAAPFVGVHYDSWQGVGASVYVGLFEMAVPFVLFRIALQTARDVAMVNQACYLAPFISLWIIHVVFGTHIQPFMYLGLLLIVAGSLLASRPAGKPLLAGKTPPLSQKTE